MRIFARRLDTHTIYVFENKNALIRFAGKDGTIKELLASVGMERIKASKYEGCFTRSIRDESKIL